jgi:hypothetical protein
LLLNNKRHIKRWALILAFFFVAGMLVISFHHHDDDGDHFYCPVCAVAHQLSSSDFSSYFLGIFLVVVASILAEKAVSLYLSLISILSSRAPPA